MEIAMSRIAMFAGTLGFWLCMAGVAGIVLSPIGYRLGLWDFAFAIRDELKIATFAEIAGVALCVVGLLFAKFGNTQIPIGRMLVGIIVGGVIAGYVVAQFSKVQSLPYIHDITTDTANPPTFVALADARKASPNGLEYKGAEISEKQKQAYPDIVSMPSHLSPAELFVIAEAAARAAGWEIASEDPKTGRIEATATTLIYGFKDDIVIRIAAAAGGSLLDMRSTSRVGLSDVGANAKRIRAFIASLKAAGV
jgi:Protein of unknown function (DUF1499)